MIPVDFFTNPPLITDEEGIIADRDNLQHDLSTNVYSYSYTSYTDKYWSLRGSVLGNKLRSYGGHLEYVLSVESDQGYKQGNDVILIGNGMKLLWTRNENLQGSSEYSVLLHESDNWHRVDRGQSVRASRLDLMNVLSNLEHILIRATTRIPTKRTSIRDVILETSVETPTPGAQRAAEVEVCTCPAGYTGNSCEDCTPLHYRDNRGSCVACQCQEDSSSGCSLNSNGYVECQCKRGYTGDRCQYVGK